MTITDTNEVSSTPRTDALMQGGCIAINILELELAISLQNQCKAVAEVDRLGKEIAFREDLDAVAQEVWDELKTENTKLREIVERYRVWATSENPTELELRHLKQKYDELN